MRAPPSSALAPPIPSTSSSNRLPSPIGSCSSEVVLLPARRRRGSSPATLDTADAPASARLAISFLDEARRNRLPSRAFVLGVSAFAATGTSAAAAAAASAASAASAALRARRSETEAPSAAAVPLLVAASASSAFSDDEWRPGTGLLRRHALRRMSAVPGAPSWWSASPRACNSGGPSAVSSESVGWSTPRVAYSLSETKGPSASAAGR